MALQHHYSLSELASLPVLGSNGLDDLRLDEASRRIWLSRRGHEQGAAYLHEVTEQALQRGEWVTVTSYPACTGLASCSCDDCSTF